MRNPAAAQMLGGTVETVETDGEYGRMSIRTTQASELYRDEEDHAQLVWMSHGDKAVQLPPGFQAVATSEQVRPLRSLGAACQGNVLSGLWAEPHGMKKPLNVVWLPVSIAVWQCV